jgi:hypothetical protein
MATIKDCEQRWQFDLQHGWLFKGEIEAARRQHEKERAA